MKKLILTVIAIVSVLMMAVPAMASTNTTTSVTVLSGGSLGNAPDIAVSWASVDIDANPLVFPPATLGDDDNVTPGTQILPPLIYQAYKPVWYFALVDDRQGDSDVAHVDVDVWHPAGSPAPYDANNYLKYERSLTRWANFAGAQNPWAGAFEEQYAAYFFDQAVAAGLITDANLGINPSTGNKYTLAEISYLIGQESIGFWATVVDIGIYYEQPAGTYPVQITAVDGASNISHLNYTFYYIPVSMVDYDFNAINFGKVIVNTDQEIDGDIVFASPDGTAGYDPTGTFLLASPAQATVRNIGNVWSKITVRETNLFQSGLPLPQGQGTGLNPLGWNVSYDACLSDPGVGNFKTVFWPETTVTLNRDLFLSETNKLDFSLDFLKAGQTGTWTGTMTLGNYIAEPEWPTVLN